MRKILIVDSDEQITAVLGLKLRKENFEVKTIASALKAVDVVKEFKPDLIISEMVLAEVSGVDFLKRVKMNPDTMKTPFIFLSNSRNVEDKILAHEMGAEAFFMKPIFIKVLINRIKDFFDEKNFKEMISSKEAKSFSGELTSISIIDILNIISENMSTGEVLIASSTSEKATIFFVNGSVVRVETGDGTGRNGVDELFKILSWLDGTFTINYKDIMVVRNINIPHDRLVMRAVNWFEDYSGELSEMPPTDSLVFVDFGKLMNNINKFPDGIGEILKNIGSEGSKISSIIDNTPFDKRQTAKYLKKMMEINVLSLENRDTEFNVPKEPVWFTGGNEKRNTAPQSEYLNDTSISTFKDLDIDEVIDEKDRAEEGKTLVPPPSFAKKDTLDPALGIDIDFNDSREGGNERKADHSININIDILEERPAEDKTEIIRTVSDDDEIKVKSRKETEELLSMHKNPEKRPAGRKALLFFIFLFLSAGVIFAAYVQYPEKFSSIISMFPVEEIESVPENTVVETEVENEVSQQQPAEIVLTEEQKELAQKSVAELISMSTERFDLEKYGEAIDLNRVALYKFKVEKTESGEEYEKVVTNMAIFLYTAEKYEEALEFAEESLLLRNDEKSIELKAAILEELKRPAAAASLLRTKLNDEKFSHKKEEWMMEINRLENIQR
ncbi:MAG TPA: response regulator [bacterium]|nr:response regulator [bacterium]HPM46291.1 response regulator [bacterium]HQN72789.1 response regulator [bacterium]HQO90921.1 response regulator [bacterium]